ncbi:MAG: CCA tRNA nucleotidyltransferase [Phycisphaerae bacterium]|nr:CCA tRNA nucleotidyltransferase [Phycisphaerae bacterium]
MTRHTHPPPDASNRDFAERIVRTLRDRGHTAYFAGGCVRDELLGRDPEDYDVATDATPDRIAALFPRTNEVGAHFGVVLVRHANRTVEVATFRTDGSYSDKRRPDSVTFSTPQEDAARRDFTVNALFLDPVDTSTAHPRGRVVDFVGGMEDLARNVLRAVGDPDQRLAEDHLRALRAARLAAKLGFEIDPGTAAAIRRHAAELSGVSRERIGDEVRKMLTHPARGRAATWMDTLGLTAAVLGVSRDAGGAALLHALPAEIRTSWALGAWALDLGEAYGESATSTAARWRERLCLSNAESSELRAILELLSVLEQDWLRWPIAKQKRAAARHGFEGAAAILSVRLPALGHEVFARLAELAATPGGISPAPLITGDYLVSKGMKPGPAFKSLLERLYDAQLEGTVTTPEAARALAETLGVPS